MKKIDLPDSSVVRLNASSSVSSEAYGSKFTGVKSDSTHARWSTGARAIVEYRRECTQTKDT